jgi:colicin import membrane protein
MLRSGFTSETILRDLSDRQFADKVDPTAEKELTEANASPALIDALKSGDNAASKEEVAQARQRITEGKAAAQKFVQQQKIEALAEQKAIREKEQAAAQAEAERRAAQARSEAERAKRAAAEKRDSKRQVEEAEDAKREAEEDKRQPESDADRERE